MAGELERLLGSKHARPRAELILALAVVEPCVAAGARAGRDGLRRGPRASWRCAQARRRAPSRRYRRWRCCSSTSISRRSGRMLRQPRSTISRLIRRSGAARSRARACCGDARTGKCPARCRAPACRRCTGIESCVAVSALRRWAGMSSGPSSSCSYAAPSGAMPCEIALEVAPGGRRCILLDQERGRRVSAEKRQQAFSNAAVANEIDARHR